MAGTYTVGQDATDESPDDLLRDYLRDYTPSDREIVLPPGYAHITWTVHGDAAGPELAPFQRSHFIHLPDRENFLTHYYWPHSVDTNEPVDFNTLPVRRKQWNDHRRDPGGFLSEATNWVPAPMQPCVHIAGLVAAYDHNEAFSPVY